MAFWLREIYVYPCRNQCGKKATVELVSPINEVQGRYCKRCGEREVKRCNADPRLEANLRDYSSRTWGLN